MDPLTALLDVPRARGAFLLRVTMSPPWAVRVQDQAPLTVVAVTAGSACYAPDKGEPVWLRAGDTLLIARPDPYLFADDVARAPQVLIHPTGRCETLRVDDAGETAELAWFAEHLLPAQLNSYNRLVLRRAGLHV